MLERSRKRRNVTDKANVIVDAALPKKKKKKNPAAVALGRKGGLKGGKARALALSPAERADIARQAAIARWKK